MKLHEIDSRKMPESESEDVDKDDADVEFQRILRVQKRKNLIHWNRISKNQNLSILEFTNVENTLTPTSRTPLDDRYLDVAGEDDYEKVEMQSVDIENDESCLQIISSEQLNDSSKLMFNDQSFALHSNLVSNSHEDESIPLIVPDEAKAILAIAPTEQTLIQKYFKEAFPKSQSMNTISKPDTRDAKIADLEATVSDLTRELVKCRQQTNKFRRERDEWERKEMSARNENDQQNKWVTQEMATLKEEHMKEVRRLKKEKKDWETQRKLSEILPTKREREEFEVLKEQFQEQFGKWKERDARMILAQDRLKKKVLELEKRNKELQDEVRILERDRASQKQFELNIKTNIPPPGVESAKASSKIEPHAQRETQHFDKLPIDICNHSKSLNANSSNPSLAPPLHVNPLQLQLNQTHETKPRPAVLKKASRQGFPATSSKGKSANNLDQSKSNQTQIEPKRMTEFDAAKTDLDQLQRELGLGRPLKTELRQDGSRERVYGEGSRLLWCLDGTMRFYSSDNISVVYYSNGDSKTVYPDKRKVYWYNGPKTKHTTYPDGVQVCQFEDGQTEKRYPDNTLIVEFPDKTTKTITPDGMEKVQYPDGMVQQITENGARVYTTYPDGVIELVTEEMVSKLYKNGIIKMNFPDGSEETRWPNGQIRLKDSQGHITMTVKT